MPAPRSSLPGAMFHVEMIGAFFAFFAGRSLAGREAASAGPHGRALFVRLLELDWLRRTPRSRALKDHR